MSKVLKAMEMGEHGLLESPTGTGKTLAFLTSAMTWQKSILDKIRAGQNPQWQKKNLPVAPPAIGGVDNGENVAAPDANVPIKGEENLPVHPFSPENGVLPVVVNNGGPQPMPTVPKIIYCTRTHSQLKQIVKELRNCHPSYLDSINMTTLGSRQQGCINKGLRRKAQAKNASRSLDELCRDPLTSCRFYFKQEALAAVLKEKKVWDIEDAVPLGEKHVGCPYYAARQVMRDGASLIFAPYNYIIDRAVRDSSSILLDNATVIFDEAHNIEDVCREAGSCEMSQSSLVSALAQLKVVIDGNPGVHYREFHALIGNILRWLDELALDDSAEEFSATPSHATNNWTPHTASSSSSSSSSAKKMHSSRDKYNGGTPLNYVEWGGEEVLDIFAARLDLTEETLKMYWLYLDIMRKEIDAIKTEMEMERQGHKDDQAAKKKRAKANGGNPDAAAAAPGPITLAYEAEVPDSQILQSEKDKVVILSAGCIAFINSLLITFDYMLREERRNAPDYHVLLQRVFETGNRRNSKGKRDSELHLNIWCMSAAVVFREVHEKCHSVLLTSGTLSPLDSFASELDAPFPHKVEASHVINIATQLFVSTVASCNGVNLNCEYKNQSKIEYQDAVGAALLATARNTPGGVLMFVPSYGLLGKLHERWTQTGLLAQIENTVGARTYVEPRDTKTMNEMLVEYYGDLDRPRGKAIMLAVCRGKISEGINFSDHYARAVIIVGIPFPSIADLKIHGKKDYQDRKHRNDPNHLTGDEWYKQQAYRAVNQAVGRCIRHKNDHGAILLLDPRFAKESAMSKMSKWMRGSAVNYDRFEDMVLPLRSFFKGLLPEGSDYLLSLDEYRAKLAAADDLHRQLNQRLEVKAEPEVEQEEGDAEVQCFLDTVTPAKRRSEGALPPLAKVGRNDTTDSDTSREDDSQESLDSGSRVTSRTKSRAAPRPGTIGAFFTPAAAAASKVADLSTIDEEQEEHESDFEGVEVPDSAESVGIADPDRRKRKSIMQSAVKTPSTSTSSKAPMVFDLLTPPSANGAVSVVSDDSGEKSSVDGSAGNTADLFQKILPPSHVQALLRLVVEWEFDPDQPTSLVPASLVGLELEWVSALRLGQWIQRVEEGRLSQASGVVSSDNLRSLMDAASPINAGHSGVVGRPKTLPIPAGMFPEAPKNMGLRDAGPRVSVDGLFTLDERWCGSDGVAYQLVYLNLAPSSSSGQTERQLLLLLAVKVIAASQDQSALLGACFAHPALVDLLGLSVSSAPLLPQAKRIKVKEEATPAVNPTKRLGPTFDLVL